MVWAGPTRQKERVVSVAPRSLYGHFLRIWSANKSRKGDTLANNPTLVQSTIKITM